MELKGKKAEFHTPKGEVSALAYWQETRDTHIKVANEMFETQFEAFNQLVEAATAAIKRGNKIIMFGNGGSAADAQHIVAEMSIKLCKERSPIASLSLSLDASAITACAKHADQPPGEMRAQRGNGGGQGIGGMRIIDIDRRSR